jgi:hypothetical protein
MDDRTYGWNDASRRPLLYVMLGDALAIVYQKKKKEKKIRSILPITICILFMGMTRKQQKIKCTL